MTATLSRPKSGIADRLHEIACNMAEDRPSDAAELTDLLDEMYIDRREFIAAVQKAKRRRQLAYVLAEVTAPAPADVAAARELAASRESLRVECEAKAGELRRQADALLAQAEEALRPLVELDGRLAVVQRQQIDAQLRRSQAAAEARQALIESADPAIESQLVDARRRRGELQRALEGCRRQLVDRDALAGERDRLVSDDKATRVNGHGAYGLQRADVLSSQIWQHDQAAVEAQRLGKQIAELDAEVCQLELYKLNWRNFALPIA